MRWSVWSLGMYPDFELIIDLWDVFLKIGMGNSGVLWRFKYIDDLCMPQESHLEHPLTHE